MSELIVSATPDKNLVFTNHVFVSDDEKILLTPRQPDTYVQFKDAKGLIYVVRPHKAVKSGEVALNSVQREACKVSSMAPVLVTPWNLPSDGSANLQSIKLEVDLIGNRRAQLSASELEPFVQKMFLKQVFTENQAFCADFNGTVIKLTVLELAAISADEKSDDGNITRFIDRGVLLQSTTVDVVGSKNKLLDFKAHDKKKADLFNPKFKFADMGIGGLDAEFGLLFRRSFASRMYPAEVVDKFGMKHVKGILLFGPPGTGKTLIARQIGKMLNAREPKVVNGPEILNKFVGASEENIRKLFADAEVDYKENGESSDLHIIIFDEIDAICKARGRGGDSTGVHDTIVNQLLTKIDGVDSLNNILVIGMTNRKDMIDPALLRPGRLEVHIEISLPDEAGRVQIFNIHLKKMIMNNLLDQDVNIAELAARTKNFSGAEIEGLVRSAASFALYSSLGMKPGELTAKPSTDMRNIKVNMAHFEAALEEVHAAFGVDEDELLQYTRAGLVNYGDEFDKILSTARKFINQVRDAKDRPLKSLLLKGVNGSGKTTIACSLALECQFPFVKIISTRQFNGYSEAKKINDIVKVFEDAYKSPLSLVILDEIESLIEYVSVGPRFSTTVLQCLITMIKQAPTHGHKLMVVGTTASADLLESLGITQAFKFQLDIPELNKVRQIRRVLEQSSIAIDGNDSDKSKTLDELAETCFLPIAIDKLLQVIDTAKQENKSFTRALFAQSLEECGFEVNNNTSSANSTSFVPSKLSYYDAKPNKVERRTVGRRDIEEDEDE